MIASAAFNATERGQRITAHRELTPFTLSLCSHFLTLRATGVTEEPSVSAVPWGAIRKLQGTSLRATASPGRPAPLAEVRSGKGQSSLVQYMKIHNGFSVLDTLFSLTNLQKLQN